MGIKEANIDIWVVGQLQENGISFDPQGSTVMEISQALKTASKRGTGKVGRPEFVAKSAISR